MSTGDFTYRRCYGMKNDERKPPLVSAGGFYWYSKGGLPAIYPDQWIDDRQGGFKLEPLPSGTEAIQMTTGVKVTVP